MTGIKLSKLPDRPPVKLTVNIEPELSRTLARYADFYRVAYDQTAAIADLIPAIVDAFLEGDRAFARWCRDANDRI